MYTVILNDPKTGHVFNPNGTLFRNSIDERYFDRQFSTFERAQKFGRGVVRRYPFIECVVLDSAGKEAWRHRNDEWLQKETELWLKTQAQHLKQQKRDKTIFLVAIVGFSIAITSTSLFLSANGFSYLVVLVVAVVLSIIIGLIVTKHW